MPTAPQRKESFREMLLKTVFREIRRSLGRYLAIFAIVALGVGFLNGLRVTKAAMLKTLDGYAEQSNLFDYEMLSTLGFTQSDVDAFAALSGVRDAVGSYSADFIYVNKDGGDSVLKAHSLMDGVNVPELIAGRMPQSAGECVADANRFSADDIGGTIVLSASNSSDTMEQFAFRQYHIVGIVKSATYINFERGNTPLANGALSGFVYLLPSGFQMSAYTEIYVTLENGGYVYSKEYDDNSAAMEAPLKELAAERAETRYDQLKTDGQAKIEEAKEKLADGQKEYDAQKANGEQQISDAENKLSATREQLDSGWNAYREGLAEADAGETQLASAKTQLDAGLSSLNGAESEYTANKAQLDAALSSYQDGLAQYQQSAAALQTAEAKYEADKAAYAAYEAASGGSTDPEVLEKLAVMQAGVAAEKDALDSKTAELAAGKAKLDATNAELTKQSAALAAGRSALDEQWSTYSSSLAEYNAQKTALSSARDQLEETYRKLTDGEEQYKTGVSDLADAKETLQTALSQAETRLSDGAAQISDAEEQLDGLKEPSVYALDRYTNVGYACFENDADIVEHVSYVFPMFFFLVAALVCITTMTRMVDEQRTQIGTLKAMGYGDAYIMAKFMIYSGSASLLGCAVGFFGGSYIMPIWLWQAYNIMYGFGKIAFLLDWKMGTLSVAAFFLCAMGATWLSCRSELRAAPAELIRPKSPKAGKRILLEKLPFLWNRFGFLLKVSLRNMFRYRKRLWMMIVGIGGCTALLLTGFGINDSIRHVVDDQYNEITVYDAEATFSNAITESDLEDLVSRCDLVQSAVPLATCSVDASAGGTEKSVIFVAMDGDEATQYVHFHTGNQALAYPGEGGALINNALASVLHLHVGDTLSLRDSENREYSVTISGIFDNYIYNYIFVSPETLASSGFDTVQKTAFVNFKPGADPHAAAAELENQSGVDSVSATYDLRVRVGNMMSSMNYIVLLVTVCAGALAFIVIFDLTNINITERIREIATIKVLGFYPMETEAYVFRENMLMTAAGSLVGLGLGVGLHAFVMSQIKIDLVSFPVRITPLSYLYAVALTFVFAFAVAFFMYYRLKRIPMAESLKSIE